MWIDGFIGSMAAYAIVLPLTMIVFGALGAASAASGASRRRRR